MQKVYIRTSSGKEAQYEIELTKEEIIETIENRFTNEEDERGYPKYRKNLGFILPGKETLEKGVVLHYPKQVHYISTKDIEVYGFIEEKKEETKGTWDIMKAGKPVLIDKQLQILENASIEEKLLEHIGWFRKKFGEDKYNRLMESYQVVRGLSFDIFGDKELLNTLIEVRSKL